MSKDFTSDDFLKELDHSHAVAQDLVEIGQAMVERAAESKRRSESLEAISRDLKDGSIDSVRRAKDRLNFELDQLIARSLGVI